MFGASDLLTGLPDMQDNAELIGILLNRRMFGGLFTSPREAMGSSLAAKTKESWERCKFEVNDSINPYGGYMHTYIGLSTYYWDNCDGWLKRQGGYFPAGSESMDYRC